MKKIITKPVKVEFYTKEGKKIFFNGFKTSTIKVDFYSKKK